MIIYPLYGVLAICLGIIVSLIYIIITLEMKANGKSNGKKVLVLMYKILSGIYLICFLFIYIAKVCLQVHTPLRGNQEMNQVIIKKTDAARY